MHYPPSEWSAAKDHADVRLGENRFTGGLHRYRIQATAEEISVDITLTGEVPPWRPATIDGENVGLIRRGEVREFSVTPGMHSIRLKIDWCGSPELSVNIRAGETIGFICTPGGSPLRLWDLVVNTGKYIHLAQDAG